MSKLLILTSKYSKTNGSRTDRDKTIGRYNRDAIARSSVSENIEYIHIEVTDEMFLEAGFKETPATCDNMKYFTRIAALHAIKYKLALNHYLGLAILDDDIVICNPGSFYDMCIKSTGIGVSIAPYSYSSRYAVPFTDEHKVQFNAGVITFNMHWLANGKLESFYRHHLSLVNTAKPEELNGYMFDEHVLTKIVKAMGGTCLHEQFNPLEDRDLLKLFVEDSCKHVLTNFMALQNIEQIAMRNAKVSASINDLEACENEVDLITWRSTNPIMLYHAWKGIADSGENYVRRYPTGHHQGELAYDSAMPKVYTKDRLMAKLFPEIGTTT